MNLEQLTKKWVTAQVVDQPTADRILQFEGGVPRTSWVMYEVAGIGVTVVATGIISTVAANWDSISDTAKLIAYFILLATLALFAFRHSAIPGVVRETLFTLFAGMILAGIGLIGQIYHLKSDGYSAIFLWLALILPLTLCATGRLINHLWFAGLCYALIMWAAGAGSIIEAQRLSWLVVVPFCMLGAGYWLFPYVSNAFAVAARIWSFAALLLVWAVVSNISWANGRIIGAGMIGLNLEILLSGVLFAVVGITLRRVHLGRNLTFAMIFTVLALGALILPPMILPPITLAMQEHQLLGCALFLLSWGGAATIAAMSDRRRLFDFAAFVIGVRFIVIYFEVFGSLAATGIGLIVSGLVILGIAYLWHNYRGQIAKNLLGAR